MIPTIAVSEPEYQTLPSLRLRRSERRSPSMLALEPWEILEALEATTLSGEVTREDTWTMVSKTDFYACKVNPSCLSKIFEGNCKNKKRNVACKVYPLQASVTHITWRNIALACKDITSQKCTWWSPHCSLFQLLRESTCRPQPTTLTPSMLASRDLLRGTPPPGWHRHNSTAVVSCHTHSNSFQSQHN